VSTDEPVLTLRRLQADYPQLVISTEFCGRTWVWVARGADGHRPWLVLSSDLGRFRAALGQLPRA
jgi:hypothetical protein